MTQELYLLNIPTVTLFLMVNTDKLFMLTITIFFIERKIKVNKTF